MSISFQRIFFAIATVVGLFAIMILAKSIFIPIAFAFLIAFILLPVTKKYESWGASNMVAAFLSIFSMLLIVALGIFLFSNQVIQLSDNLSDFKGKILNVFADVTIFINRNIGFVPKLEKGELLERLKNSLNESGGSLLSQTFSSTANVIFGLLTSIIYTFLILIYRKGLIRALVSFYPDEHKDKAFKMFQSVQKVGQQYLFGMMVIVLILGFVNSTGLLIIGIDNPFLFGFLAAVLALIPYAGTIVGSALPVLYAFISHDSLWMPVIIIIFFWLVQVIESNVLTPKIVGGNLKINAFTSIVSIIIGASVWGIAGMILFLPFAAMLKEICEQYVELKPLAMLIGDENYNPKNDSGGFMFRWFSKMKSKFSKSSSSFESNV